MNITGSRLNNDIDKIINLEDNNILNNYINDININDDIASKLYDYQIVHVSKMLACIKNNNIVLDGSDTGTGKTYCTIALCKQLNKRPLIICPKSVIPVWNDVIEYFKIKYISVINYEFIRNGKLKCINNVNDDKYTYIRKIDNKKYKWNLPKDVIIILDEAHRCKNINTINGKLMLSLKNNEIKKNKKILLSGTIADTIKNFAPFGYLLNLYKDLKFSKAWIKDILRQSENTGMKWIYKKIYPIKGSRMIIQEIPNFPKSQIISQTYTCKDYNKIDIYTKQIKKENKNINGLIVTNKLLQKIELIKVPIFVELTKDLLNSNFSVIIFLNYLKTIDIIKKKFEFGKVLKGDTDFDTRYKITKDFQQDKIRLLIVSKKIQEGISFHDTNGVYPRGTLISPDYSSQDLIQTLGRVKRVGSKSRSLQKIIFVKNSFEESIAKRLDKKIKFNENINGNDFKINI